MKTLFQALKAISLFCLFVLPALADESTQSTKPKWEFWTGALIDTTWTLNTKTISGGFFGNRTNLSPSIGYYLSERIELIIEPSFNFHTSGNYVAHFLGGICGNFDHDTLGHGYFGKALVGFDDMLDNRLSDDAHFTLKNLAWSLGAGKRFALSSNVTYAPELRFSVITEKYSNIKSFTLVPFQLTFLF